MKPCSTCKTSKALTEFYPASGGRLTARCKPCILAANRISRKKHWETHLEYMRKYRARNPEKFKAREKRQFAKRRHLLLPLFERLRKENKPYASYKRRLVKLVAERITEYHETLKYIQRRDAQERLIKWI